MADWTTVRDWIFYSKCGSEYQVKTFRYRMQTPW